jgi:diguanylate cyclase (GGDEF)-like protein
MISVLLIAVAPLVLALLLLGQEIRDRLRGLQGQNRARTEAERIAHLAYQDPVTGLPNRRAADRAFEMALERAGRTGRMIAVHSLDLDDFKQINDRLGHATGDAVLCEVARRLSECIRKIDTAARLGGDEFEVIQDVATWQNTSQLKAWLHECLREPIVVNGLALVVGVSSDYALYPADAQSVAGLRAISDQKMYVEKEAQKRNGGMGAAA